MTALELHDVVAQIADVKRLIICGRNQISGSAHNAVHPIASPPEQHAWEAEIHPPKSTLEFDFPVFTETVCFNQIDLSPETSSRFE